MQSRFRLTGNPFVDTGLFVIAFLANADSPDTLSLDDAHSIYGDGVELARINSRLKSFTMVFGMNGPLTQTGYRPAGQKRKLSDKNIKAYTGVLSAFLHQMQQTSDDYPLCEICGDERGFDFNHDVRQALTGAGVTDRGIKQIGREWFPLAGSPGNDAQALPSASRGLSICAKCLFAVHYLPQGLMLMQGRLVCFQANYSRIAQELTGDIVYEYQQKLNATDDKIEMLGKKEGTTAVTRRLMSWMSKLQQTKKEDNLPESATLNVWLFTNAGASADCEIIEVPNHALRFLWQARKQGLEKDLMSLLSGESKIPEYQLLPCIQERRDYSRLYPFKTFLGASPELFALYHQLILGERSSALRSAQHIARARLESANTKEKKTLKKSGVVEQDPQERKRIRKIMQDMARDGQLTLTDYAALFPTTQVHPIRVDFRGWRTIGYYLSHPDTTVPDFSNLMPQSGGNMKVHPKIKEAARLYFDDFLTRKGAKRFERDILDGFTKTNPNGVQWLRDVFIRLAKEHSGFTYEDWDDFVLDENGQPQAAELLFQMRLELSNLYREYAQRESQSN